jgi:hypothetical protein
LSLGFAVLALILLAFAVAGNEEPVGGDWRVMRSYAYGEINAEKGITVLYMLADNGKLGFFHDSDHRELILVVDTSSFPNPQRSVERIVFEDTNGDGYNDLKIPVSDKADKEYRVWRWNPSEGRFDDES